MSNTAYKWEGRDVDYCRLCDRFIISCDACNNGSCNGGGCDKCHDMFTRWSAGYSEITKNWFVSDAMMVELSDEDRIFKEIFGAE